MFQNVLMTALTPLGNTSEVHQWENRPFTTVWPEEPIKEIKHAEAPRGVRKKPNRIRTAFTTEQLKVLEKTYNRFKYIDMAQRKELAASLNIGDKSIKVWFQNRRMKEKRRSSESSCDSSETSREISPPLMMQIPAHDYYNAPQKMKDSTEPHYELPDFHVQAYPDQLYGGNLTTLDDHQQNAVTSTVSTIQSPAFIKESSVYPTQYYPSSADYNYSEGNYQYDHNIVTSSEYWSPSGFDLTYF